MDKSVYLSPSTQENNVGVGNYGTEEQVMNRVSDVVEGVLNRHDIKVYRNKPSMTLREVVADSNAKRPTIHFAIHSNSGGGSGCEVFCWKKGETGEDLANMVYNYLSALTPMKDRGVQQGYDYYGKGVHMYEVTYTNAPAALVEVAFHDNSVDANWILNNIRPIGETMAKALINYLGVTYISPTVTPQNTNCLYRVMCGSYVSKDNAEAKVKQLQEKGFEACVMTFSNGGGK
jgi:N-acetylmuramoyl-L-alanine amidase